MFYFLKRHVLEMGPLRHCTRRLSQECHRNQESLEFRRHKMTSCLSVRRSSTAQPTTGISSSSVWPVCSRLHCWFCSPPKTDCQLNVMKYFRHNRRYSFNYRKAQILTHLGYFSLEYCWMNNWLNNTYY